MKRIYVLESMLIALDKNGQTVNILENNNLKEPFYCPACKSPVRLKKGKIKISYFAHVSLQNCSSWSENESVQHLELKLGLYQWLRQKEKVEIEKYLPQIQQTADLLVNDKLAIEIQCSPLSLQRLKERTLSYRANGYYVLWLQGKDLWLKNSLTALQESLLYYSENRGFYFWELDLEREKVRLKSLIHQDLRGRLIYLTEEFDWFQGELLEVLRLPFKETLDLCLKVPQSKGMQSFIQRQLYHQVAKWLKIQGEYYEVGENLLTLDLDKGYWSPPGLNLLTYALKKEEKQHFYQLEHSLENYYRNFYENFSAKELETLHAPRFYAIIKGKNEKEDRKKNGQKA